MSNDDLDVLETALHWLATGRKAALLTVAKTYGSSPRPAGSLMAVCAGGDRIGSVSGGCVDDDIVEHVQEGLPSRPEILRYGDAGKPVSRSLLPCGGHLEIVLEPLHPASAALIQPALDAILKRTTVVRHLDLETGHVTFTAAGRQATPSFDGRTLTKVYGPKRQLLLIGATHVSYYVAKMAQSIDFCTTVCEPRSDYADSWRLPHIPVDTGMPDDVVKACVTDNSCAVVALTHDLKLDDMALLEALPSPAFYVGALGSKRTDASRRQRLVGLGIDNNVLDRLRGPVGIAIGSRTPAEIAISILAEIILEKNRQHAYTEKYNIAEDICR